MVRNIITLSICQSHNIHWSNSNSSNLKTQQLAHVFGTPVSSHVAYLGEKTPKRILHDPASASASASASQYQISSSSIGSLKLKQMRLGPKITEIVKGKLSLGAEIIRAGGVDKIFKHHFSIREGEKLLKAPQCYLSTTAGPIAGPLFISTDKVAFCSDRSMKLSSPTGEFVRIRYKVLIPVGKILRANASQNVKRPSKKYIEIVTVDNFDFWFMGFLNYHKTLKYLQQHFHRLNTSNLIRSD